MGGPTGFNKSVSAETPAKMPGRAHSLLHPPSLGRRSMKNSLSGVVEPVARDPAASPQNLIHAKTNNSKQDGREVAPGTVRKARNSHVHNLELHS